MRVGIWHHFALPVFKYGGTERIAVWLADALAELGHEPVLITPKGSRSESAEVVAVSRSVIKRAERDPEFELDPHLPRDLDVLHCFSQVRCRVRTPLLIRIGGNGDPATFPPGCVFLSRDHMERHRGLHWVHNGLNPDEYEFRAEKDDYLLFLAKAGWKVKGVDRAERIARRTGSRLIIAGGRRFNLTGRIRSVGQVGGEEKVRLLAGARALLFPIRWEEPFGIAVIEALASGTPVIASNRGSMPEILTPEVGILCDESEEEFVRAVERVDRLDPHACRRRVEEHFTARRMAEDYLALYRRAIDGTLVGPARAGLASG